MARRKLKTRSSSSNNTAPENNPGISPVAQILQSFATGGPSVTKGLTPVGNADAIGADNSALGATLSSTIQNRFNMVNQVGQEALRRTEMAMQEERAKQEAAKQAALQKQLQANQQKHAQAMQNQLLAAQQKAQREAIAAQKTSVGSGGGGGSNITLPTSLPTVKIPSKKNTSKPKEVAQEPKFPPAVTNQVTTKGTAGGKSTLPKCEAGFAGIIKRGLGLCQ